jgi:VWFA-related protein
MDHRRMLTGLAAMTLAALLSTAVSGQDRSRFQATIDFVATDVVVRKDGKFVPDLQQGDFRVYEDGVLQTITHFEPWIGGRSLGNLARTSPSPTRVREGLILPTARPAVSDGSGRLFIIFIDDLHFQPSATPRVRALLRKVRDILIHDNDLVGFVSSGRSSIEIDPAYDVDHRRFDEAIDRTMGSAASPDEIVEDANMESAEGPPGLRYNAHVAFKTAFDMIDQVAAITDRRKIFIYVSEGYTLNPFSESRLQKIKDAYANSEYFTGGVNLDDEESVDEYKERESLREGEYNKRTVFSFGDLINELAQLERAAQRANVTFYPIDPRGMIVGGDVRTRAPITYNDWRDYFQTQLMSLRVLAEGTGGFCVCEVNNIDDALRRIDAETSDFYRLGYSSSNPDPLHLRRQIRIEVTRPGLEDPIYRREYTIPPPPRR